MTRENSKFSHMNISFTPTTKRWSDVHTVNIHKEHNEKYSSIWCGDLLDYWTFDFPKLTTFCPVKQVSRPLNLVFVYWSFDRHII